MQVESESLKYALAFISKGIPVFPIWGAYSGACGCGDSECKRVGKHPVETLVSHGCLDATLDKEKAREWWTDKPSANVGVLCGKKFFVIDIDPCHGGRDSFNQLEKEHGPLPETTRVTTGGGGTHIYLAINGVEVKGRIGLLPGIDIKSAGGYVVAPPSIHKSGQRYSFENGFSGLAVAPTWLIELINGPKGERFDTAKALKGVAHGQRYYTLISLAGKLRYADVPFDVAIELMNKCGDNCQPPAEREDVRKILSKAYATWDPGPDRFNGDDSYECLPPVDEYAPSDGHKEKSVEDDIRTDWPLFDVGHIYEWPKEPLIWITEGMIPKGGIGFMSAPPKDRKSLLTLDLTLHLAQTEPRPWLGKFKVSPAKTLYIAREDPLRRISERTLEICRSYQMPIPEPDRLQFLVRERIHLNNPWHRDWLKKTITDGGFELLILDVINRMHPDLDEISAKDMGVLVSILEELNRELGVTILADDHTRKPQGKNTARDMQEPNPFDMKGSIAKYGCADFMICLARTPQPNRMQLYSENKDSDDRLHFFVDVSGKGSPEPKFKFAGDIEKMVADMAEVGTANREKVYEAIDNSGSTSRVISTAVGLADATVRSHLSKLSEAGKVTKTGFGKNTIYFKSAEGLVVPPQRNRPNLFGLDD